MVNCFWDTCKEQADHDWLRQKKTMQSRRDRWPQSIQFYETVCEQSVVKYNLPSDYFALLFFSFILRSVIICLCPTRLVSKAKLIFHAAVHGRVTLLLHTLFTWLHNAGAKKSFIYLTALLTPNRRERDVGIRNEAVKDEEREQNVERKWHIRL